MTRSTVFTRRIDSRRLSPSKATNPGETGAVVPVLREHVQFGRVHSGRRGAEVGRQHVRFRFNRSVSSGFNGLWLNCQNRFSHQHFGRQQSGWNHRLCPETGHNRWSGARSALLRGRSLLDGSTRFASRGGGRRHRLPVVRAETHQSELLHRSH